MVEKKTLTLRSGIEIPLLGFGPGIMGYSAKMKKQRKGIENLIYRVYNRLFVRYNQRMSYVNSISNALQIGFRLLDYSNAYRNFDLIKSSINKSGIDRDQLFVTSRISNPAQFKGNVRDEFLMALEKMGLEYIDLLQFHWPVTGKYVNTWKDMISLKNDGYVRVLGVANCHAHHIEELEKETGVLPEIDQIEIHPLFTQKPLLEYLRTKDIVAQAYTPVARYDDRLVRLPLLKTLEKKYNKSFIQIILRWHIQNGVIPVVCTHNPKHQKDNIDIFDFSLSDEDMALIDSINIDSRLRYHPDNCDFSIL